MALHHVLNAYSGGFHVAGYKTLVEISRQSRGFIISKLFLLHGKIDWTDLLFVPAGPTHRVRHIINCFPEIYVILNVIEGEYALHESCTLP